MSWKNVTRPDVEREAPARWHLHRLERKKWISADWDVSENRQRVRVYKLTPAGRKQLAAERTKWEQLSEAIAGVMRPPVTEGES